ncbi:hypothetical protein H2201_004425 [Coniosporium apollinis]|uniref:LisH domain-containing protein n=1 Tax=Coniosporium apollinis TaxID=61459 RepID=A0ABQ9NY75_9PEZI|nr:hypothetical protein H2201_004425 [Coniosporium apollinis]
MSDSAVLVARYLKTNGYDETLCAFIKEAGLKPNAGSVSKGDLTIEQILREKQSFDLSVRFEKTAIDDDKAWRKPSPSNPSIVESLPTSSNVLHISADRLALGGSDARSIITATTADRRLNFIDPDGPEFRMLKSLTYLQDSPILSCLVLQQRYVVCTGMSGKIIVFDCHNDAIVDERRDHTKYTVKVVGWLDQEGLWIATAGWDAKVLLYRVTLQDDAPSLGAPVASLTTATNPETLLFVEHPESSIPVLLLTRRDSTFMYYYTLPPLPIDSGQLPATLQLLGKQNLAPHSNAWVAFSPSAVAVCPTDRSMVAVATSTVPHMKLLIVRLLLPPIRPEGLTVPPNSADINVIPTSPVSILDRQDLSRPTQASQARVALAIQDREAAAILISCTTLAPQTQYSTPALAWRPDGSGVWVNSDDGVIRGIEASTGKIVANLEGHVAGSKVRCLWAGYVDGCNEDDKKEELLVSGGFDQRLILWRVERASDREHAIHEHS